MSLFLKLVFQTFLIFLKHLVWVFKKCFDNLSFISGIILFDIQNSGNILLPMILKNYLDNSNFIIILSFFINFL